MSRRDEIPIIWLHGFMGAASDLSPFASDLEDSHRCILVELPAHGSSASVPALSIENAADSVAHQILSADASNAVVVGYSLGGRVALSLANRHPELVRALILESASPGIVGTEARRKRRRHDARVASQLAGVTEQAGMRRFVASWYRQPVFASLRSRPELMRRLVSVRATPQAVAAVRSLAAALEAFSPGRMHALWEALPRIVSPERPTLFIAGEQDGKYQAIGRRMAAAAPGLQFCSLKGAGHIGHFERPQAYATAIQQFLDILSK